MKKIAREKLKNKNIRWTEAYTDKTAYLKEQYEDTVGKGSYFRFEGKAPDGDEYYCILSPARVHNPIAKWFAGVRKLPATYSAGGKYFESMDAAATYALETWGVPRPKNLKPYTSQHLRGIGKRIEKWKEQREAEGKTEPKDEKESRYTIKKSYNYKKKIVEAMPRRKTYVNRPEYTWFNILTYKTSEKWKNFENENPQLAKSLLHKAFTLRDRRVEEFIIQTEKIQQQRGMLNAKVPSKDFVLKNTETYIQYNPEYGADIINIGPYVGEFRESVDNNVGARMGGFSQHVRALTPEYFQREIQEIFHSQSSRIIFRQLSSAAGVYVDNLDAFRNWIIGSVPMIDEINKQIRERNEKRESGQYNEVFERIYGLEPEKELEYPYYETLSISDFFIYDTSTKMSYSLDENSDLYNDYIEDNNSLELRPKPIALQKLMVLSNQYNHFSYARNIYDKKQKGELVGRNDVMALNTSAQELDGMLKATEKIGNKKYDWVAIKYNLEILRRKYKNDFNLLYANMQRHVKAKTNAEGEEFEYMVDKGMIKFYQTKRGFHPTNKIMMNKEELAKELEKSTQLISDSKSGVVGQDSAQKFTSILNNDKQNSEAFLKAEIASYIDEFTKLEGKRGIHFKGEDQDKLIAYVRNKLAQVEVGENITIEGRELALSKSEFDKIISRTLSDFARNLRPGKEAKYQDMFDKYMDEWKDAESQLGLSSLDEAVDYTVHKYRARVKEGRHGVKLLSDDLSEVDRVNTNKKPIRQQLAQMGHIEEGMEVDVPMRPESKPFADSSGKVFDLQAGLTPEQEDELIELYRNNQIPSNEEELYDVAKKLDEQSKLEKRPIETDNVPSEDQLKAERDIVNSLKKESLNNKLKMNLKHASKKLSHCGKDIYVKSFNKLIKDNFGEIND